MVKIVIVTYGADEYMGSRVVDIPKITAKNLLDVHSKYTGWMGRSGVMFAQSKPEVRLLAWKNHKIDYKSIPTHVPGWDKYAPASYKAMLKKIGAI